MTGENIKWTGNLRANLAALPVKQKAAIRAAAEYIAPQAEGWMRSNAPWTDRTSNARNGLQATVEESGTETSIVLYHSVPYGIFLEVRWGGKFAILEPAINFWAPKYMEAVAHLLFEG